ncbi:acyl-CoA synthetase [Microbulbifer hainanensis]|uniref:acyl-CoA synthetase n=1 Tax=Microbulbifer hainanensis TaxID=2735675 RepID=UPI0018663B42|nr:acyl-CoA synthetase [Microbulbifer hainanensis]
MEVETDCPPAASLLTREDLEQFEAVPLRQRYPWLSSFELLSHAARKFGDDPALSYLPTAVRDEEPIHISYRQLLGRVCQMANLLHALDFGTQDAVAILLPMIPQAHIALWGSQAAGIASPINPLLEPEHIAEIINTTGARALVAPGREDSAEMWQKVQRISEMAPGLEHLILVRRDSQAPLPECGALKVCDLNEALSGQPADRLVSNRQFRAEDIAAYFHTGGTTGRPKVARLTHGNIAFVAQNYAERTIDKGRFTTLAALPLFHIYGTVPAGIATLFAGRRLLMMTATGFRNPNVIQNCWHHVARFQIKGFATVPTVLALLLQVPADGENISCLQDITSGSAPLPSGLKAAFEEKFQVSVINGYGMTESTGILNRPFGSCEVPAGSVGMRLPYMELKVADLDGNRIRRSCGAGEVGSVLVRGPHIFAGYLNPTDNEKVWVEHRWFNTGDLGFLDAAGNLTLTGRAKDLIIRGGHNIDPALIEDPLSRHPAVAMAVAIGQPDAETGELPAAFVTLCAAESVSEESLLKYCREHISERAAVPKRIEIIKEMPLTAVGKVFKPELRNRATEFALTVKLQNADIEARVSAWHDPQRGLVASVALDNADLRLQAEQLLRGFPLTLEFRD